MTSELFGSTYTLLRPEWLWLLAFVPLFALSGVEGHAQAGRRRRRETGPAGGLGDDRRAGGR